MLVVVLSTVAARCCLRALCPEPMLTAGALPVWSTQVTKCSVYGTLKLDTLLDQQAMLRSTLNTVSTV